MRLFVYAGLLAALVVASAAGQEGPVEIKPGYPKVGDRLKTVVTEKVETKTTSGGKDKTDVTTTVLVYTDEVEVAPAAAKKPTKLKRTFDKATVNTNGKTAPLAVQGKTVQIEKRLDKYTFAAEGKAVDAASLAVLDAEFNKPARNVPLLFPARAKMGDGWELDRAKIVTALGAKDLQLDKSKATGTGKFPLVEMRGERRFGAMQLEATAPVTGLGDKSPLQLKSGKYTFTYKNELCIDSLSPQTESSVTTKLEVTGTSDGRESTVVTTTTEDRKVTVLPPEKKKK